MFCKHVDDLDGKCENYETRYYYLRHIYFYILNYFLSHEFICFAEMLRTDISKLLKMGNRAVSICRRLRRLSADNFFMI